VSLELLPLWGMPMVLGIALGVLLVVALIFAGLLVAGSAYVLADAVRRGVRELAYKIRSRRRASTRAEKR